MGKTVGIITIHNSPNYGACLQTFALFAFLKDAGVNCEIINLLRPTHKNFIQSKKYIPYRKKDVSFLFRIYKEIVSYLKGSSYSGKLTPLAKGRFDKFNSSVSYSKEFKSIDALYQDPPQYDIYISGSDQLWNPTMKFCIEPYFLTFVNNGGAKISYATSIGITELYENEKKDFSKWLSDYDAISVREKSASVLISELVGREVKQVCDPSILLKKEVWEKMMKNPSVKAPYILLFTLRYDKELLEMCVRLKKESNMNLVYLCLYQSNKEQSQYYAECNAGPLEFLGYISHASMVITNSFHGTVFSLLLESGNVFAHIPSTQKRGSRIIDLLENCGLKDHIIRDDLSVSYQILDSLSINYDMVRKKLTEMRDYSRGYLLNYVCQHG